MEKEIKIEKLILHYVNKSRRKRGRCKLKSNKGLKRVARSHSNRMAKKGKIWHGKGVHIARESITHKKGFWGFINSLFSSYYYSGGGENVAMMMKGRVKGFKHSIRTSKDIASALHKIWMKNPDHKRNILDSKFSLIGIRVKKGRRGYFATELFYG